MSSTPLDLPVLIAQMDHAAKIISADRAKPEVEQQIFAPLLQEKVREKEGKIQQVEKKEKADPVDRDGSNQQQQEASQERKEKEREPDDDPETGFSNPSPWSGNIVNVKI